MAYYIHNEIAIDTNTIETLDDNGQHGDTRVELKRGARVDGAGIEHWLETNGGPRVITLDTTDWSVSVEQAAEALGGFADGVRAKIEEHVWQ